MSTKRLHPRQDTVKIELRLPAGLKRDAQRVAERAAMDHGEGDLSTWLRELIRRAVEADRAARQGGA